MNAHACNSKKNLNDNKYLAIVYDILVYLNASEGVLQDWLMFLPDDFENYITNPHALQRIRDSALPPPRAADLEGWLDIEDFKQTYRFLSQESRKGKWNDYRIFYHGEYMWQIPRSRMGLFTSCWSLSIFICFSIGLLIHKG